MTIGGYSLDLLSMKSIKLNLLVSNFELCLFNQLYAPPLLSIMLWSIAWVSWKVFATAIRIVSLTKARVNLSLLFFAMLIRSES